MTKSAETVEVAGLGKLPVWFSAQFEDVDFVDPANANGHDEGQTTLQCRNEPGFFQVDDSIRMAGRRTTSGYQLSVVTKSESKIGLWNKGSVVFDYNANAGQWSLSANTFSSSWLPCNTAAVIDKLVVAMQCFGRSPEAQSLGEIAFILAASIQANRDAITVATPAYAENAECGPKEQVTTSATKEDPYEKATF